MINDEHLNLPDNWGNILEQCLIKSSNSQQKAYICSPCRGATSEEQLLNMKAARVYMFYSFYYLAVTPIAPHAYFPLFLCDSVHAERGIALEFGKQLLKMCNIILVCGKRLTSGMNDEIVEAAKINIPIMVFDAALHMEIINITSSIEKQKNSIIFNNYHLPITYTANELFNAKGDLSYE